MKKLIANLLLAIVITVSLSTFVLAQTNVRIKSAINTSGAGKCLDVAGGKTTAGTPIVQFDCHNGTNQRFSIYRAVGQFDQYYIQSALNPNMCVGTPWILNAGDLLRLVPCRANGLVQLEASWNIDSVNDKRVFVAFLQSRDYKFHCIDVPSGLANNSLWMQLYNCHNGGNQQWSILNF